MLGAAKGEGDDLSDVLRGDLSAGGCLLCGALADGVGDWSVSSVATAPGSTTMTRMLGWSSRRSDSDQPFIPLAYLKMLTERAATSSTVTAEIADSVSMRSFAHLVSGIASVGLNAIEFVNEMYT